jgi:hypothetical protein
MDYAVPRYIFNHARLTMFMQNAAPHTPLRIPDQQDLFSCLGGCLMVLSQARADSKRPERLDIASMASALGFMGSGLADSMVYELYLPEETGTDLADRLAGRLPDPGKLVEGDRLPSIVRSARELMKDRAVDNQVKKINDCETVKQIESRRT